MSVLVVSQFCIRMKLKHYIMRHDSTNYLYVKPLQNQGLVLAPLLRAQVCLYGFCDEGGKEDLDREWLGGMFVSVGVE